MLTKTPDRYIDSYTAINDPAYTFGCKRPFKVILGSASPFAKDPECYLPCLCGHDLQGHKMDRTLACTQKVPKEDLELDTQARKVYIPCSCKGFTEYQLREFHAKSPLDDGI